MGFENYKKSIYALTGIPGSGKSTVLSLFKDLGAFTCKADDLAKKAIIKGTHGYQLVVDNFGTEILDHNNQIIRQKLGDIVFKSIEKRKLLESIIHPIVADYAFQEFNSDEAKAAAIKIYEIPLLFELQMEKQFRKTIAVLANENICIERIKLRDNCTKEQAIAKIKSQLSLEAKAAKADYCIYNEGSIQDLKIKVKSLWIEIDNCHE